MTKPSLGTKKEKSIEFKPQPTRFLSCFWKGKRIIVLTGFIKKTQKLPKKELKRAKEYLQQFKQMEGE